ncbi:MAG: prepilin-type N-terminal cleavage/methylation domain-containing protein [Deltaproteobacteria bacterium]|nr:prepilin-type N-terminal cleavage/methylation domain-containing protein [Deltaproteobacteria bacterium]
MERINSKGFTLIELILAMTLLGIIVVVSGVLMGRGVDAFRFVTDRTDVVQQARLAMTRVQKELELLKEVQVASPDRVVFLDETLSPVEFRLDGTDLRQGNDILASGIQNLRMTYYQSNGNETSAAPQVRRIHIDMTLQTERGSGTLDLRTDIFPRNYIYENFR